MKTRPGCGCLVLVLGVINILVLATLLWGIVQNPENIGISLLMLVVFVGNVAVCFMVGLPAIRRRGETMPGVAGTDDGEDRMDSEGEGEDEEP